MSLFRSLMMQSKSKSRGDLSRRGSARHVLSLILGAASVCAIALGMWAWSTGLGGRSSSSSQPAASSSAPAWAASMHDWSFDDDAPDALSAAAVAARLLPDAAYAQTLAMQAGDPWDTLERYASDPGVQTAMSGRLQPAAPQALALGAWVRAGRALGWCNSPLADRSGPDCRPAPCLVSGLPGGAAIDLTDNPLTRLSATDQQEHRCPPAAGGQRPFPVGATPQVAFILTTHNNDPFAAKALLELFRTSQEADAVSFMVYDDASTVPPALTIATLLALRRSFGSLVAFRRGTTALGFGAANHEAIRATNAMYILLVNTDMYVTPGWLAALLHTAQHAPRAGLVGPMYIGNNTLVTEAGGIVFSDAGAANFGRGFAPSSHEYAYLRRADYISAACVLFLRHLYFALGGFDPQYEMGYYEDTDLALAVRKVGLFVMYQPGAIVFHQEGNTLGTDESPLKQRLMATNRGKFYNKWKDLLSRGYFPSGAPLHVAAIQRYPVRALWIMNQVPVPLLDLGAARGSLLLHSLLEAGFHVTVQLLSKEADPASALQMRIAGADVIEPRPMASWQLADAAGCMYDLFVVSGTRTLQAAQDALRAACPSAHVVFDAQSLTAVHAALHHLGPHVRQAQAAAKVQTWLKDLGTDSSWFGQWEQEAALISSSMLTLVASDLEARVVEDLLPKAKLTASEQSALTVHMVGAPAASGSTDAWASSFRYHVPSDQVSAQQLGTLVAGMRVMASPLLPEDLGLRDLALTALVSGLPLVTTPAGMHLLGLERGEGVGASSPAEWAQALLRLLRCEHVWADLSAAGARLVLEPSGPLAMEAGWEAARSALRVLKKVILP